MDRLGVIVTDGNERSTLAAVRALGKQGIPVFVGAETSSTIAGSSRHCAASFTYPSPWQDPDGFVSALLFAAKQWNVAAIYPMTDIATELIGERKSEFEQLAALAIPALDRYHQLSDKYLLAQWAGNENVAIPKTIFVENGKIEQLIDKIDTWPVVVKPGRSLLKADGLWRKTAVEIARNADHLRHIYHEAWYLRYPSMIQQYICGHGEGVFGLFQDGEPRQLFAHRRIRERPPSGGVSVLREAIALPEVMTDYAVRIMREARWNGIAMVEFKVELQTGIPYLMEVNGRFWGSLQLAVDAGIDFPTLLYRATTEAKWPPENTNYDVGIRSQWWLGDVDHVLSRLRGPEKEKLLPPETPSRATAVKDLLNIFDARTRNEVLRINDPVPGILELHAYALRIVRAVIRKITGRLRRSLEATSLAFADRALQSGGNRQKLQQRFPIGAKSVLVLCKGNICRSSFAEKYLAKAASQRNLDLVVSSAGLDAVPNIEAYPMARAVAPKFGVDLDNHRTTAMSQTLVDQADVILVMEPGQERQLETRFPGAGEKTFLLGPFSPDRPATEITDPYGGGAEDFDECYRILISACDGLLTYFTPDNTPGTDRSATRLLARSQPRSE